MSGHSKWAQIKRQKGVADIKRGLTFTKLANAITIAVRQSGGVGDPNNNFRLRLLIDKARAVNMPKENIERAIQRALGKQESEVGEIIYEGFAPYKVALIVEAVTDNRLRTNSEVKNIFDKGGGIFGQQGSVSYMFKKAGKITVKKENISNDEIFLVAIESGAEDIEEKEEEVTIYTSSQDLAKVKDVFMEKKINIIQAELVWMPTMTVVLKDDEKIQKVVDFIGKLEAMDDVQKVSSNLEIKTDNLF